MDIDVDDIINNLTDGLDGGPDQRNSKLQVAKLKAAWINERMSPELLDFEADLLDKIMVRVREQVIFIEEQSMNIQPGTDLKFILLVVESELERIKFLIRGYLRIRLSKIDKYTVLISGSQELMGKLSESERAYMERHFDILKELYKGQFLSNMPPSLQLLDDKSGGISMVEEPDLNTAVFLRVLQKVEHPVIAGQDRVLLEKGGVYVMRYSAIERLLKSGMVELV
jgi:GINS complex subunit 4